MTIDPDEITKLGETQTVEFKKSLSLYKEALETLCGMLNSESAAGQVLFGVLGDGTAIGVQDGNLDSVQKKLAERVEDGFEPQVMPSIEILDTDGKILISLKANRPPGIPYYEYRGSGLAPF